MRILTFIFARGGSKGIRKKNIVLLKKKPLIYYSIEIAKKFSKAKDIFVSTDDVKIAKISKNYKVEVIKRPKSLSQDKTPEIKAWKHAINYVTKKKIKFDIFLSLPTTSPLRSKIDVKKSLSMLKKNCDIVVTGTKSRRNPWYNILKINKKSKYASMLIKSNKKYSTRQTAPSAFDMTTVAYVTTPKYVLKAKNLLGGKVKVCEIPQERALDIDNYFDLRIAEFLINDRNVKK